jgi:hypothetical protein
MQRKPPPPKHYIGIDTEDKIAVKICNAAFRAEYESQAHFRDKLKYHDYSMTDDNQERHYRETILGFLAEVLGTSASIELTGADPYYQQVLLLLYTIQQNTHNIREKIDLGIRITCTAAESKSWFNKSNKEKHAPLAEISYAIYQIHILRGIPYPVPLTLKRAIADIVQRFKRTSPHLTQVKERVLNDFFAFYELHSEKPQYVKRTTLLLAWAKHYQQLHQVNPFSLLHQQRRKGCLSIFNPSTTDSIKLMYRFLGEEEIPGDLKQLMREKEMHYSYSDTDIALSSYSS